MSLAAQQLVDKNAVVTGAASGIGAATSLMFARHGAKIVCVDLNEELLNQVVADINDEFPGQAIAVRADVSSVEDTKRVIDTCVNSFGSIDIFYANAGILNRFCDIADEGEEQFMRALSVNTLSVFMALKYAGDAMAQNGGGSIICTASVAAMRADLTPLQYTASKGAILSMIKSASDRFLLHNVRVNAVVPGGVMTPLMMSVAQTLEEKNLELKGYDHRRFPPIHPDEIASVVTFLASDASSCIKGQAIIADGGMINSMGSQPYPSEKTPIKESSTVRANL